MSNISKTGSYITLGALCLMVVAVPLSYVPFPFLYPTPIFEYSLMPKRFVLHICIAAAILGWLLQARRGRDLRLTSSPLVLPALCFMGVALLSAPATTHPLDTLAELADQAALIALFLVAANTISAKQVRALLWANAVAGLIVGLIGILQYHDIAFVGIPTNGHPSATFGYRNFAAMYLICAIPLSALLFFAGRSLPGRLLSGAATTLMAVYLVYTRTRGAWIGAAGALLVVGGLILLHPGLRALFLNALRPALSRPARILLLAYALLFALLAPLPARFRDTGLQRFDEKKADIASTVASITATYGDRGRLAMWRNTLRLIADHPFLGVGPGGWKRAYPPYDRGAMIRLNSSPKRPHNDYLWIASEYGLIGLGIYLWLLFAAFGQLLVLLRHPDGFRRVAAAAFALALLATSAHAFFSFPREQPQAAMFPYLIFGIVAGTASTRRNAPVPRILGPLFLGLLLLLSLAAAELSRRRIAFDGYYLRAILAEDREDWSAVLSEAETAYHYGVFRPHLLVIQGLAEDKLGHDPEAEAAYRRTLTYAPHTWYAHNGLGIVCKRQGRFEEALTHFREALRIFPGAIPARNNLGALYRRMGDIDRAEQEYRAVLSADPGNPGANNNLGNIYKARGRPDSAAAAYRRAIALRPDFAQAYFNLGNLAYDLGRYREAGAALQAFLSIWRGDSTYAEAARKRLTECRERQKK